MADIFKKYESDVGISYDSTAQFTDCFIEKPDLSLPLDKTIYDYAVENVTLRWTDGGDGADWHVAQICLNKDFRGPSVQGFRVDAPDMELELDVGGAANPILKGPTYFWRVLAYKEGACCSEATTVRSFVVRDTHDESRITITDCDTVKIAKVDAPHTVLLDQNFIVKVSWSVEAGLNATPAWAIESSGDIPTAAFTWVKRDAKFAVLQISGAGISTAIPTDSFVVSYRVVTTNPDISESQSSGGDVCTVRIRIELIGEEAESSSTSRTGTSESTSTSTSTQSTSTLSISESTSTSSESTLTSASISSSTLSSLSESTLSQSITESTGSEGCVLLDGDYCFAIVDGIDEDGVYDLSVQGIRFRDGLAYDCPDISCPSEPNSSSTQLQSTSTATSQSTSQSLGLSPSPVECNSCDPALVSVYNVTLAGLAGDLAAYNGTHAVEVAGLCNWNKSLEGATVSLFWSDPDWKVLIFKSASCKKQWTKFANPCAPAGGSYSEESCSDGSCTDTDTCEDSAGATASVASY